jgi:hypothetical protein
MMENNMKAKVLVLFFMLLGGLSFAQSEYPLVSIRDIQYIDSADTKFFVPSLYTGDTIRVQGVVMVRPVVEPVGDRNPILYYGARWGTYIQDTSGTEWVGLNVLQDDTTEAYQNTFFDIVDTSDIVELTGVIITYGQTNELMLLINPVTPVNIVGKLDKRPEPIKLSISDFMNDGIINKSFVKYSGMYVEIENGISSDRNTNNGQFRINNEKGDYLIVYPQSRYFRLDNYKMPGSTYQPPQDGTPVNSIRGIITPYNNTYEILPLYPEDITITLVPPTISDIRRDIIHVKTNEDVTISAKVAKGSGNINSVNLHYRVDGQERNIVPMTKSGADETIYTAVIPGIGTDSAYVDYYISAGDDLELKGYNPSDTVKNNYFFQVLNADLKIRDLQYTPFGGNYTSYYRYPVTVTGIVTSDTAGSSYRTGNVANRIIIQDDGGAWSGIWLSSLNSTEDVQKVKLGDNVTVTGILSEDYNVTRIDSISALVINSSNNTVPAPQEINTGDIGAKTGGTEDAEKWESVLLKLNNIIVTDLNADGDAGPVSYNYGEISVDDGTGSMRVELQDGNHYYHNFWSGIDTSNHTFIMIGDSGTTFESITGYLYFSHSYYKLVPRYNDDFVGYKKPTSVEMINNNPVNFAVNQNYPNPFNPSTIISYSIPKEGMVTVKVFNILGQEVATLVNTQQAAGTYKVNFDASSLSTGVYFYSVKTGNFSQVKKMMLIK